MEELLRIDNLWLEIQGRDILKGLNLVIKPGDKMVLFGPNGAGKSSLLGVVMGFPNYKIKSGKVFFKGKDITGLTIDQRVKMGLGIAFQNPPSIRGIKLQEMLKICKPGISANEIEASSNSLNLQGFLDREVNLGFSGGEAKRAEMLQIFSQSPEFAMFDEPDSGVDLENIELIGKRINEYLARHAGLVITHQGYILNFIEATRACVLYDGKVICHGNAKAILEDIKTKGYAGCVACQTHT